MGTYEFVVRGDYLVSKVIEVSAQTQSEAMEAFARLSLAELDAIDWHHGALTIEEHVVVTEVESGRDSAPILDRLQTRTTGVLAEDE
ncbi:TPA: hypothetical protein QEL09_001489 [Stenotrophomonas maltophilia]|nr:hypothetical protein [Stenotrophomonas geniculata]HDS1545134.1 hypothetical protein [Stenotrophomonas maltophilia]